MPLIKCPITKLDAEQIISNDIYYRYSVTVNKYLYNIKIATEGWDTESKTKLENNWVLMGMLFNNEWDIDQDVIITPSVISQVIRIGEYPRNFEEKLNHFLLNCHQKGVSPRLTTWCDSGYILFIYSFTNFLTSTMFF